MGRSEFHDYSTWRGRFFLITSRINWLWLLPAIAVVVIIFTLSLVPKPRVEEDVPNETAFKLQSPFPENCHPLPINKINSLQDGHYIFESEDEEEIFSGLDSSINVSSIKHFEIRRAVIDLNLLTSSLEGAMNLKSINITAQELLSSRGRRIYLPKLERFHFSYIPLVNADVFKKVEILHDIMFFEVVENQEWDFIRDVLNLQVHVSVLIDGTTLLDIDRKTGLLNINLHFCSSVLRYVQGEYNHLALSWCGMNNISLIHPSVKYLNLNNAIPRSPTNVSTLIKSLKNLEEFHAYQPFLGQDDHAPEYYWNPKDPELQIPVNLDDFSLTLQKLSLCRMALISNSPDYISSVIDLTLQESDVDPIIINQLEQTFPNLKTVRLFSLPANSNTGWGPKLLLKVLKSNATKIVVTGFKRDGNDGASVIEIDRVLRFYGMESPEENFLVLRNWTGLEANVTARAMTHLEINYKRYESMGFKDIDTYNDYLLYDSTDALSGQTCFTVSVTLLLASLFTSSCFIH